MFLHVNYNKYPPSHTTPFIAVCIVFKNNIMTKFIRGHLIGVSSRRNTIEFTMKTTSGKVVKFAISCEGYDGRTAYANPGGTFAEDDHMELFAMSPVERRIYPYCIGSNLVVIQEFNNTHQGDITFFNEEDGTREELYYIQLHPSGFDDPGTNLITVRGLWSFGQCEFLQFLLWFVCLIKTIKKVKNVKTNFFFY